MRDAVRKRMETHALTLPMVALAFVAFTGLDCVTTACGVTHGAYEMNPFTATVISHSGIVAFLVTRTALAGVVLAGLHLVPRRPAAWAALLCTALTGCAVVLNVETLLH